MRPLRKFLLSLLVIFLGISCYFRQELSLIIPVIIWGFPSIEESDEIGGAARYVKGHYHFANLSKSQPNIPPIFANAGGTGVFGPTPHHIVVYSVQDSVSQNTIVDLIRDYKKQTNLRPIIVEFYKEENWETWTSTRSSGGKRGPETLIRTVKLR
jgi:hypothetical protein